MALMSLNEARRVLKEGPQAGAENFVRHATASAVIYMNDAIKRGHMTRDGSGPSGMRDEPGWAIVDRLAAHFRTQDQLTYRRPERPKEFEREEARGVDLNRESWANIQRRDLPNEVSGEHVMDLPLHASAYYIATNPETGKAALYHYGVPKIDAGEVGKGNVPGKIKTADRGPAYYAALRHQGQVARELAAAPLRAINEANRQAWSKR
jgi:hypothetical protein